MCIEKNKNKKTPRKKGQGYEMRPLNNISQHFVQYKRIIFLSNAKLFLKTTTLVVLYNTMDT